MPEAIALWLICAAVPNAQRIGTNSRNSQSNNECRNMSFFRRFGQQMQSLVPHRSAHKNEIPIVTQTPESSAGIKKKKKSKKTRSATNSTKSATTTEQPTDHSRESLLASKTLTPNMKIALEALNCMNDHRSYAHFYSADADILFREAPMTMSGIEAEMEKLLRSFPDFHAEVHDVIENKDGSVTAILSTSGTHTGEPYAFGPYPEIPTSNKRVQNNREYVS